MLKTIEEYEAETEERRDRERRSGILCPCCEVEELRWDPHMDSTHYLAGRRWAHCPLCKSNRSVSA